MALDQSALLELVEMLKASDDGEVMRKMLTTRAASLDGGGVDRAHRAAPHQRTDTRTTQRTDTRTTQRNGTRDTLGTTAGR